MCSQLGTQASTVGMGCVPDQNYFADFCVWMWEHGIHLRKIYSPCRHNIKKICPQPICWNRAVGFHHLVELLELDTEPLRSYKGYFISLWRFKVWVWDGVPESSEERCWNYLVLSDDVRASVGVGQIIFHPLLHVIIF